MPTDDEIARHKITYEYDIDDNITNVTYPSSTSSDVKGLKFTYNSDKWLQKIEAKVGLSNKLLREYNYLNDGKVASIKDYRDFAKESTSTYTLRSFDTDPSGHFPILLAFDAAWGAYDGYQYAKKKNLRGWKKAGAIVGGAVLGTINPFKKLKVGKVFKRVAKIVKKRKSTKAIAKRVYRVARKTKVVTKRSYRKARRKATRTYRRVRCKITKKGCFTAGTLISTKDGDVPIEDIEEGDLVWAQDSETGDIALKKVVQTFEKETDTILYIKVAGEVIEATEQHVFYIDGVGWIPASMIEEGDVVVLQSGDKSKVEKIDKVVHNELIRVYNFEVEDFHTYFVSDASVLVHNDYSGVRRKKVKASKKGTLKNKKLPTKGKIRYVPSKNWNSSQPLPKHNGGYVDKFENIWTKGPSRTAGQSFEWDVQLSKTGKESLGWASRDGSHLNVSLDGKITHK